MSHLIGLTVRQVWVSLAGGSPYGDCFRPVDAPLQAAPFPVMARCNRRSRNALVSFPFPRGTGAPEHLTRACGLPGTAHSRLTSNPLWPTPLTTHRRFEPGAIFTASPPGGEKCGLVSYVESVNAKSLRSCERMGYKTFGKVRVFGLPGHYYVSPSCGCEDFGFRLVAT